MGRTEALTLKSLGVLLPSGAERDRTVDLRLAKPALSQLSYSPERASKPRSRRLEAPEHGKSRGRVSQQSTLRVGQGRLELPTSRLSGVRSNHLSYWPGGRGETSSEDPS